MDLRRHWWSFSTAAIALLYATVSLTLPRGHAVIAFGDVAILLLIAAGTAVLARNAVVTHGQVRLFWALIAIACLLWTACQALWTYYEVGLRRDLPDPFVGDVILFIHIIPVMAAVALRPHRPQGEHKLYFSTLNFLMLLMWWLFLYAFIVFPDEYIVTNARIYSRNYDFLYLLENLVLLTVLGISAISASGAWKRIYWNLFIAFGLYTFCSETMNAAIARGQYYSGSIYDVPFVVSVCWLIGTALLVRRLEPAAEPLPPEGGRWISLAPRLAMAAILSLPAMGFVALFADVGPPRLKQFRILVTLAAMLVLGSFVFARQYLLDRQLVRLLRESHQSLENLQRLQSQLVQQEKLASLGQLVAGAAHEINNPLAAILGYSELLAENEEMQPEQVSMARKIGQQARRTRDLVSGLLSFAQQAPADKTPVDLGALARRALQMEQLRLESKNIRWEVRIPNDLSQVSGNANQLFQCCLQIISNAMDAMEEVGGGTLTLIGRREGGQVVLEFADSGPGIREPRRVFDPFYTTKPIGKGAGLGLSATYGVVQDHQGQVTCHNLPEGGACFVLRLPVATPAPLAAAANV
ncbi:MAG TPA: ATP-binding protein [Terriglobales bacterium]|nr:ATP-binding protein [Terriglobales bacterium]